MQQLNAVIQKYKDTKFCDLESDAQTEYLRALSQQGAMDALKSLGLDDEYAPQDLRDVRDLLKSFRVIRKTAISTMLASLGRIIGWIIILSLAGYFLHSNEAVKKAAVDWLRP